MQYAAVPSHLQFSANLSSAGMPSFRPLHLRISATSWLGWLLLSKGTPGGICQWSNTLGKALATDVGVQIGCETKGLIDRQVGLDHEHGGASHLRLLKHMTSLSVKDTIDAPLNSHRTLYLHKVIHRFHEGVCVCVCGQHTGTEAAPCCGDDLASTLVDSISM